jgi:hypothetical protein
MRHALPTHAHPARTVSRRLAWLAHVGLDRGLGFGLRTPAGFQRG